MKKGLIIRDKQIFGVEVKQHSKDVISSGECFTKKWRILNLSNKRWKNLSLQHIDKSQAGLYPYLKTKRYRIAIPDTKVGESAEVEIKFIAPDYPCYVSSHWDIVDEENNVVVDSINLKFAVLSHPELA